jgi:fructose-1,6-bisphosphatase/inositol monophosphatase family enzyme
MGALIVDGLYQACLVAFPAHGQIFSAVRGQGCLVEQAENPPRRVTASDLPNRALVAPRVSPAVRRQLAREFDEVVVSRCSAVDSSVIALGRARAALSEGRSDRRRAIGYLLSLEVGATILHGNEVWKGEDPELLEKSLGPSIVAPNEREARRVLELTRGQ